MRQIADFADAFDKPECVFVDEQVLDDVSLDLGIRGLKTNVLRVEVDLFEDIQFLDRPLRSV